MKRGQINPKTHIYLLSVFVLGLVFVIGLNIPSTNDNTNYVTGYQTIVYVDPGETSASLEEEVETECTDSDGGRDYYVKGTITRSLVSGPGSPRDDICVGNDVRELFCNDEGKGEPFLYTCPNGCSNGACLPITAEEKCDSTKIELVKNQRINKVKPILTESDLLVLLDNGRVSNAKGDAQYTQTLSFTDDNSGYVDYLENKDDVIDNFLYFKSNNIIANYSLFFTTSLESDVDNSAGVATSSGNYLTDFEDIEITMLGKTYTIVQARRLNALGNSINLTLMGGAVKDTLIEGNTTTYTIGGTDYETYLDFVDTDSAKFTVNGETTRDLLDGETYILGDGLTIGISEILYQNYAGGVNGVTFFLGAQKIELRDTDITDSASSDLLTVNDEIIDDAHVIIQGVYNGIRVGINKISVDMIADDSFYVAVGEKLSENEELVEPQVLFTQNWDIRLNSYDNTNDLAVVEIGKLCPLELSVETEEIRATETFDLSQYPYPFVKDGEMNSIIIVGDADSSETVITASDIAAGLHNEITSIRSGLDTTKLASEVPNIRAVNSILVGGPCANAAAAEVMGNPADCTEGLEPGKGIIKLFEHGNGNVAVLVAGYNDAGLRRAAHVLANYKDYASILKGKEVEVTGTSLTDIQVNPIVGEEIICTSSADCGPGSYCYSSSCIIGEEPTSCSQCGEGLFNLCDDDECTALGNCEFIDNSVIFDWYWEFDLDIVPNECRETKPTGSIKINNDAETTTSTQVTLSLSCKPENDCLKMQIAELYADVRGADPQDYTSSISWTLTPGDGTKAVYVRYNNTAGVLSNIFADTIELTTSTTPTESRCSECGDGVFNRCDFAECRSLGSCTFDRGTNQGLGDYLPIYLPSCTKV